MPEHATHCRLAVDIGGTFTDVVLEVQGGRTSSKVLTTHAAPDTGVMRGISQVLQQAQITPAQVDTLLHGTTLATNALIERKGARTALLTTQGFRDILEMGFEKRFAQYNLGARPPAPLVPRTRRFTVAERISAKGDIVTPLDKLAVREAGKAMQANNIEAVAIGFLHAYAYPQHEQQAAELIAAELPDATICLSSEVCPEIREYERFSTTVANAYIRPMMAGYLQRLADSLSQAGFQCPLFLMMSGGGLTTLEQALRIPIRLVESGPAGGAILAADLACARGIDSVLAFDMGGTTAKISLIEDGKPDRSRRFEVAREFRDMKGSGLPIRIPVIEMVEIGAGGGSIARVDEMRRIKVGPDSAGSDPGPAAYALGGQSPTVTDANLMLGKLDPRAFAGGSIPLDQASAERALQQHIGDALKMDGLWPAAAVVEIVDENMANAARVHAIERGKEPSEYTMIAFGGGAPLHAARLAGKLGIRKIIVPLGAGVGSAIGFLRAPVSYQVVRSYRCVLAGADLTPLNTLLGAMAKEAIGIASQGAALAKLSLERQVELCYLGQGHTLSIALPGGGALPGADLQQADLQLLRVAFETAYQRIYGLTMPDAEIECVSWTVVAATPQHNSQRVSALSAIRRVSSSEYRNAYDAQAASLVKYAVYLREQLQPGDQLSGPAIVQEPETSTFVPMGYTLTVDQGAALWLVKDELDSNSGSE